MKKIFSLLLLSLLTFSAFAQTTDAGLTTDINTNIRTKTLTSAKVANEFQKLVDSKVNIIYGVTANGTNTYTATVNSTVTSYVAGQHFIITFTNACSGASTLNLTPSGGSPLGAKSIKKSVSTATTTGDILSGEVKLLVYDGTNFQIVGGSGGGGSVTLTGDVTGSGNPVTTTIGAGKVTNAMLAGGITNANLVNSSMNIAGNATSLGGSVTQDQITGLSTNGLVKRNAANTLATAVANNDYTTPLIITPEKTVSYTAAANEFVPADLTSGNFVLTLPNAPADGTRVGAKIVKPTSSLAYTYTINSAGSDVFNRSGGPTSATLSMIGQAQTYQYKASSAVWYVVSDDEPLSQLDSRYNPLYPVANTQTSNYTAVAGDEKKINLFNSSSAINFTIPQNVFSINTIIAASQVGSGLLTIVPASGVTFESNSGTFTSPGRNTPVYIYQYASNTWKVWNGIALPSDLNTIASLSPANDDVLQRKSGAWTNRTLAQLQADLIALGGYSNFQTLLSIHTSAGGTITLTNQANSEQFFGNTGITARKFDATGYTYIKVKCQVSTGSASVNDPRLYPQYSLDNSTYVTIGTGTSTNRISLTNTGHYETDWISLPSGAKADVYFRIAQNGGDGSKSPVIGYAVIYLK